MTGTARTGFEDGLEWGAEVCHREEDGPRSAMEAGHPATAGGFVEATDDFGGIERCVDVGKRVGVGGGSGAGGGSEGGRGGWCRRDAHMGVRAESVQAVGLSVRVVFRRRRARRKARCVRVRAMAPGLPNPGRRHDPDNLSFDCGTGRGTARACTVVEHTCQPLQPIPCCV